DHAIGGTVSQSQERVNLVPLTVALEMMAEAASLMVPAPHMVITALKNIRAVKRIRVGAEGTLLSVRATRTSQSGTAPRLIAEIKIIPLGSAAGTAAEEPSAMSCEVEFAEQYPAAPPFDFEQEAQQPWREPNIQSASLYDAGYMFHGPRMQSVRALEKVGARHITGFVETEQLPDWLPSPAQPDFLLHPLLLDNATQLVLFHLFEHDEPVKALLPFYVESLEFFTDLTGLARTGGLVKVHAALKSITRRGTEADVSIVAADGRVAARFTAITSRRIVLDPAWKGFVESPLSVNFSSQLDELTELAGQKANLDEIAARVLEHTTLPEDEPTLAWCADYLLSIGERKEFEQLPNLKRKADWLAGRITLKETIRELIAKRENIHPYLADIVIQSAPSGQPLAAGPLFYAIGWAPHISITHKNGLAMAVAAHPASCAGVGIDLEPIVHREPSFERLTLTASESEALKPFTDPAERDCLLTVFWCAKEAVGKAIGVGLSNNPKSLAAAIADGQPPLFTIAVSNTEKTADHQLIASPVQARCIVLGAIVVSLTRLQPALSESYR
ncbi:MAG TPA: polyketide synthase dehydratase domain-containing protein, partial [Chroococcales cyanobacterium]